MPPRHSNPRCFFLKHPYRFNKTYLMDYRKLNTFPDCDCYEFALCHNDPTYENYDVSEEQYQTFLKYSSSWKFLKQSDYRYNLRSGRVTEDRDPFVYTALKEYDLSYYYDICDKNKTPRTGRMYFSLLQYLYPKSPAVRDRDRYFWKNCNAAINHVMKEFDQSDPISWIEACDRMPKNTSAGLNGLQYSGSAQRKRKGDIMPFIKRKYLENYVNICKNKPIDDYCMFAMRGHLSDRLKIKTRPVWLVSASTIISELRYYTPFYDQIQNKKFFRDKWITGHESMPRLNRYLRRHPEKTFYNTDISGWDSYRAAWFHELIMRKIQKKLNLNYNESKEYDYCVDSAIRTKVLFPNGQVWQKYAGIISGTAGTLLFNSLLNTIAGLTILSMMKSYSLDMDDIYISKVLDPNWLGDDFAFFFDGQFDLEKFSKLMFKYFNVIIKPEKTVIAKAINDRKYLGYQLKDGFLFRETKELFQSLLYSERPFPKENSLAISFSRFFSYLLIGGINDPMFVDFFYYYMGRFKDSFENLEYLYEPGMDNIFKLLKDVWNVKIEKFNLESFRDMNLIMLKYCLLYGYDLRNNDLKSF